MFLVRFLLGVLLFCIGYATRVCTDNAFMPRDLVRENEELTRANIDLVRSNQALREMLHQHVEKDVEKYSERIEYESKD